MRWRKGESLLELLLAIAIFMASVTALAALFIDAYTSHRKGLERAKATELALEGIEAARSIRDANWTSLTSGTYGVTVTSTGLWAFTSTSDTTDGIYTRQIELAATGTDAYRVTSTVSWLFSPTQRATTTFATVLTNWRRASGAGGGCIGNWASPSIKATMNLTGSDNATAVAVSGTIAYVGRDGGDEGLVIIDISSSTNPVILSETDMEDDVLAIVVSGTHVYVAVDEQDEEIQTMDVSNPSAPVIVDTLNLPDENAVEGLVVSGTRLYVVREEDDGEELVVVDISNPSNLSNVGDEDFGDDFIDVAVGSGTYVYVPTDDNSAEFRVINVANMTGMGVAGSLNLGGNANAYSVATSGTLAYLGRDSSSEPEFYVLNAATPSSPSELGYLEFGGDINRVRRACGSVVGATSHSSREFAVFNVNNPASPALAASLNLSANGADVAATDDRAVVVTSANSAEVYVIAPSGVP